MVGRQITCSADTKTSVYDPFAAAMAISAIGKSSYAAANVERVYVELPSCGSVCPFCPEHEYLTPDEVQRVGVGAWQARALPSKYAFDSGRHELVICSPNHNWSVHTSTVDELAVALELYQKRLEIISKDAPWVSSWLSYGLLAGQSQPHAHIQLLAFDTTPPNVAEELFHLQQSNCKLCGPSEDIIATYGRTSFTLTNPGAQVIIAPKEHTTWDTQEQSTALIWATKAMWERCGSVPYNVVWHCGEFYQGHPHIHVLPRLFNPTATMALEGWTSSVGQWADNANAWVQALEHVASTKAVL